VRAQRVHLSDDRWLELVLTFDGLGLNSQVAYFDPAMAIAETEDAEDAGESWALEKDGRTQRPQVQVSPTASWWRAVERFFRPLVPASAMVWSFALILIVGGAGYLAYRHVNTSINATDILSQSVRIEATNLQGQTVHQILGIEEVSADGRILQQGSIDLWKDGDGHRYMRRLYDSQHRLIATEWRNSDGEDIRGKQGGRGDLRPIMHSQ
jgi:hypothetical protein